ncbi:MAG: hypothetical protein NW216_02085 [Hyphomicrobium sp.]|nr:hypothetical protein [Hyphomicrobium sp.]
MRLVGVLAISLVLIGIALRASAEPVPRLITHGRDLGPMDVGPVALGFSGLASVEGGVVSDGPMPRYVKHIGSGAVYGGLDVAGPHLLIEKVRIEGALDISAKLPVVLFAVEMRAREELPWLVLVRPGAGPLHVVYSDLSVARQSRAASPHVGVALALRADGARVHRSRIGSAADGIQIAARDISIAETLVDHLLYRPGDHNDAIQLMDGAADVEIARARIANRHLQTSAITILGERVSVRQSWLAGGGWTIYGGAKRNGKGGDGARMVEVSGNVFARSFFPKCGSFGPVTYWASNPESGNVWSGNFSDDGERIEP